MTADSAPDEEDEMLPCPFCNEPPRDPGDATRILGYWHVTHICRVGRMEARGCTKAEAVALWNTRASPRWLPIEGAPRDGTPVLVFVPKKSGNLVATARNSTGSQWWGRNIGAVKPTHYMPLPAPPEAGDTK